MLFCKLTFPASTGRIYRIQSRTNLYVGSWLDVRTNIAGNPGPGGLMSLFETNALNRVYYRIGVETP